MVRVALMSVLVSMLAWPNPASADARLDEARVRAESADFAEALRLLEGVESSSELSRVELLRFYELRAFVRYALGNSSDAAADLETLLTIEPAFTLSDAWPPDLVELAESERRAPGPIRVNVSAEPTSAALTIEASVNREVAHSELVILTQVANEPWERHAGTMVSMRRDQATVRFRAVLEGVGGAPIAESATEQWSTRSESPVEIGREVDDGGSAALWWGIGVGAVVAVGLGITLALFLSSSASTQPGAPMVEF